MILLLQSTKRINSGIYIGKVAEVEEEDEVAYIAFMVADKSRTPLIFSWPNYEDKVWIKFKHILCEVSPPTPIGKSQRSYKLNESTESFYKRYLCPNLLTFSDTDAEVYSWMSHLFYF